MFTKFIGPLGTSLKIAPTNTGAIFNFKIYEFENIILDWYDSLCGFNSCLLFALDLLC